MFCRGIDPLLIQRRTGSPTPVHRLPGPILLQQGGKQGKLLLEEERVLLELVTEQRKRLGERAASENHLGPATRSRVEGREPLEHPHGIIRAQDGNGRAEMYPLRSAGNGCKEDFRGRDSK